MGNMQVAEPREDESTSWASVQEAAHVQSVYLSRSRSSPRSPESRLSPEPRAMTVYPTLSSKGYSLNPLGELTPMEEMSSRRAPAFGGDASKFAEMYRLMQRQLLHEKNENKGLKQEIAAMQQEFAQHKAAWSKKCLKLTEDLEMQRVEMGKQWEGEKSSIRDQYEEKMEIMRAEHEMEMQEKEEIWQAEREKIREEPAKMTPEEHTDEKYKHVIEALEKHHMEEIARLKALIPEKPQNTSSFRKQPAKSKPAEPSAVASLAETSEIETLRVANSELRRQLDDSQRRCSELQTIAQGSFRKKGADGFNLHKPKENTKSELKSLLDSLQTHLRPSEDTTPVQTLLQSLHEKVDSMSL